MSYKPRQHIHQVQVDEIKPKEGVGGLPKETNTNSTNNNIRCIIANHNDRAQRVAKILEESHNNGFIMILHDINSKTPNWLGMSASKYKADLQTLLNEYIKNPDGYGYGVMIGEQLKGKFYLVAIDVDIDSEECKERISREIEDRLTKHGIHYYKEITKSNRIHYYILLNKAPKEIENISKLPYPYPCFKHKDGKEIQGEIELFTKKNRFIIVYDGNYNDKDPFATTPHLEISDRLGFVYFVKDWIKDFSLKPNEKKEPVNEPNNTELDNPEIEYASALFSKIVEAYKIIRNYHIINGWEIDKAFSAYCIREKIATEQALEGFKAIYQSEYNEKTTIRLLDNTNKKDLKLLPNLGRVYQHISLALDNDHFNEYEKELLETLLVDLQNLGYSNFQYREYLENVENVILESSEMDINKDKKPYYKERYFIERNINGIKKVIYVSIIASERYAIYKNHHHEKTKIVGIKVDIIKPIKDGKIEDYEYLINDKIIFRPSFNFSKTDDLIHEIQIMSMKYVKSFDASLYKRYLDVKIENYFKEMRGDPPPCIIGRTTGWSDDLRFFYHYGLDDDFHELHKEHALYRKQKNIIKDKDKQHKIVKSVLMEGKLLAVLMLVSASSLSIKLFNIPGVTYVISGTSGAGKTTASLIATSLFYYSNDHLIDAHNTKTGLELLIASLNSLPVLVDEAALAGVNYTLNDLIFMISSGKGKGRGRKDLTVDFKDLKSNVFWTTETTDINELRRSGAFRRMLYLVIESWNDFTSLFKREDRINEQYAGCGIDYIQYLIAHKEEIQKAFEEQKKKLNREYIDIATIVLNIYSGLILLEAFYNTKFYNLRKTIDKLLNEAKRRFIDSRDNIVIQLMDFLESITYQKFHIIDKKANGELVIETSRNEVYGEYDKSEGIYYIIGKSLDEIVNKLGKNRLILIKELEKAGVLIDKNTSYYTKATKQYAKVYKIKFSNYNPPEPQPPEPQPPTEPIKPVLEPTEPTIDEPDDNLVEAFSRTTYEAQPVDTNNNTISNDVESTKSDDEPDYVKEIIKFVSSAKEAKEKEKSQQPKEKKKAKAQAKEKAQADEKAQKEKNDIIINEDELDIYDVKPRNEIPQFTIKQKDLIPFNELIIGSFDIETTGLEETDTILAIAFNTYKNGELQTPYRFYLSDYEDNEAKMIDAFLDALSKSDIDVLTGYNIYSFDLTRVKAKEQGNRLRFTDPPVNVSGVFIRNEIQQGYNIIVDGKEIETIDAYYLVLKYDIVARSIPGQNYKLKAVAKHFGIAKEDRIILGHDEIIECYKTDRNRFDAYLDEDVREAYEVFKKLAPPYYYIRSIVPFNLTFFDAFRLSTAAIWERILEYYYGKDYTYTLIADEKKDYEGGLVINNKGLYRNVFKIDVASLYPNIMLNYWVHSRKDTKKVALAILNEYTNLRLELKAKAKAGDVEADLIQGALKILINSLYGFYGTASYLFNDVEASAMVTAYGRKILRYMIDYVESNGGVIIECDTDGVFYSAKNGVEIYEGLRQELNKINFDIELEYKNCDMYASDKKNYIIIEPNGKVKKKGSKYAGRDKNRLQTEFVVEYIKRYIDDPTKAEAYKKEIMKLIVYGEAYDWLKITKKVAKNEVNILEDAKSKGMKLEHGSIVSCAYKKKSNGRFTFDWEKEKTYDVEYYIKEFGKIVDEIYDTIGR